jgi:hypothetical protein
VARGGSGSAVGTSPALAQDEEQPPDATPAEDLQEQAAREEEAEEAQEAAGDEEMAPEQDEGSGEMEPGEGPSIGGYVTLRSRSRWTDDGDDDQNIYGIAAVDVETGGDNPWSFHVMGRGQWQIDGPSDDPVLFGIEDTWSSTVTGRLYYAYVDTPTVGPLGLARVGRQQMVETPTYLQFDGVRAETTKLGKAEFLFGLYTGFPVRMYRSEYTDKLMGGGYMTFRPWETGEVRFDYMHLVDDPRFGQDENDLLSLGLKQRVGRNVRLEGTYGNLDGENRDINLAANWTLPEEQLTVRYSFYNLFEPQTDLVNELNPYFDSLRTWFPFYQNKLTASKVFGEWLQLMVGFDFRRVDDEDDIGVYNRDFDRYYLTATLLDELPLHTDLGLTGEYWDSPDTDISSWGLDLTSRWSETVRTSLGTYYSLYKYYLDVDDERTNVRTYYVEFRDQLGAPTDVMVRYEFEDDELYRYHTLRLGITWKF